MSSNVIETSMITTFDYMVQGTALIGLLSIFLRIIIMVISIIAICKGIKALNLYIKLKDLQLANQDTEDKNDTQSESISDNNEV